MSNVTGVRVAGTWRYISSIWVRVSGVWRLCTAWNKVSGAWHSSTSPLALSMSTSSISASGNAPSTVTTAAVTGTPSGGYYDGAVTYAWTYVSGSAAINCTSPTSASTTFSRSSGTGLASAVWRLTITDSFGNTASTAFVDVTVSITRNAP